MLNRPKYVLEIFWRSEFFIVLYHLNIAFRQVSKKGPTDFGRIAMADACLSVRQNRFHHRIAVRAIRLKRWLYVDLRRDPRAIVRRQ